MNKVPRYTAVIDIPMRWRGDTLDKIAGKGLSDENFIVTEKNVIANLGTSSTLNSSTDNTLSPNSDSLLPTQKAVKSYVDNKIGDIELILISINGE